MKALQAFFAGFLATLLFHQPVLAVLHAMNYAARGPYSMAVTKPFGVPAFLSLAFWGGLWGIALWLFMRGLGRSAYWTTAIVFGAIAPTLVAWYIVAPLKDLPMAAGYKPAAMAVGLIVNAAWGLGTAVFLRLFRVK